MSVELLDEGAYRGFIEAVTTPGREPIHIARVAFGDGVVRRSYVKLYPAHGRGLVNEITGHLLAESLGLRVPDKVALIFVPTTAIQNPPAWMEVNAEESHPAWCSADMTAPAIKFFFGLGDANPPTAYAPIRAELEKSKQTPAIVAFDDWVANVDRNVGNLLRLDRGEYALIDHGQILGGHQWKRPVLTPPEKRFPNLLRILLKERAETLPFQTQVVHSCQEHAPALQRVWHEVENWWNDLELHDDDIQAARTFLHARAHFEDLPRRYGLLV